MEKVKLFVKPLSMSALIDRLSTPQSITSRATVWPKVSAKEQPIRWFVLAAIVGTTIQFLVFKWFYPYPDFTQESYDFLNAAFSHASINIQPIGYSKFLTVFHAITHSDLALIGFQYLFLESAALWFFYTVLRFLKFGRISKSFLFVFLFFNPLALYLANYVNSNSLCCALGFLWVSELLWIVHRPKWYQVVTQGFLLCLVLAVEDFPIYLIVVSILAFLFSRQAMKVKLAGIVFPLTIIVPFWATTTNSASRVTGSAQSSFSTGWRLANNALYMYGHLKIDVKQLPSNDARDLSSYCGAFFKQAPPDFNYYLSESGGNFFMESPKSPLKQYFSSNYKPGNKVEYIADWGKASALYSSFGKALMLQYPLQYVKYFVLPNIKNYLFPPLETLKTYNWGEDEVQPVAQDWFDYVTPSVMVISPTVQGTILGMLTYACFFLNVLLLGSLGWFFCIRRGIMVDGKVKATIYLIGFLLAVSFCNSVFTKIVVLRHQFFFMVVTFTLILLVVKTMEQYKTFDFALR